jgi:hypothetical protein
MIFKILIIGNLKSTKIQKELQHNPRNLQLIPQTV